MKTKACFLVVSLLQLDSPLENQLFVQSSQWQTNPLSWTDLAEESCITLNWKLSQLSEWHYHSNFLPKSSRVLPEWLIFSVLCLPYAVQRGAWHEQELKWCLYISISLLDNIYSGPDPELSVILQRESYLDKKYRCWVLNGAAWSIPRLQLSCTECHRWFSWTWTTCWVLLSSAF